MLSPSDRQAKAAIYVHWPFCLKKCPYCDFNSHVRDEVSHDRWRAALVREIDSFAGLYPDIEATSIFFGGGTPSLMEPETVEAVISRVRHHWGEGASEVTLEANPSSVEAGRFKAYREAGVDRLSMGIQSLRDDALQFLGRLHDVRSALNALEVARSTFDRVSFDLIYARPGMSVADWRQELSEALAFEPSHLSLYQLTIEEGTAFHHQYQRGKFRLPEEGEAAALYDLTQDLTASADLPAYEISNHARSGEESRHNLAYWQGDFYVGIGPGAHGRVPAGEQGAAQAHNQIKRPEDWLEAVESKGIGLADSEQVPRADRAVEAIMMGLRLNSGVERTGFQDRFGSELNDWLDLNSVDQLVSSGHLVADQHRLYLTKTGLPLLNHLLPKILA